MMGDRDRRMQRRESGSTGAIVAAWVAVVGLLVAGVGSAVLVSRRDTFPDRWDPRAADLVAFVERERGLTFKHPVKIDFLDDAAFLKEVSSSEAPTKQEQAETRSAEAMLRAIGYLSGPVDLVAAVNKLAGEGIVGLYSFKDKRVVVRGAGLDDQRRVVLVHELTHVLQDQHFDIGANRDKQRLSGETAALTAVAEADAEDVADAWRKALPAATQESLAAAERKDSAPDFKGVPPVFVELLSFPYAFGPDFVHTVVAREGAVGRNRLFTDPPKTEEQILLPETYLSRQKVETVKVPALKPGEKLVKDSEGDVGMLSLLVMLAERIDFGVAYPAVNGWAGDSAVAFERAGKTCVRADVLFDTAPQSERFSSAFTQWAAGKPATQTSAERNVEFESCDPGTGGAGRAPGHISGIEGLALRKALISVIGGQGLPAKVVECTVDGLIGRLTADRIAVLNTTLGNDPRNRDASLELQRTVAQVIPGCR